MRTKEQVKFAVLRAAEPRLHALFKRAKAVKDDGDARSFCANRVWYDSFKPDLLTLVGWGREDREEGVAYKFPDLRSSEAYSVAYKEIYDVLPACRNCGCGI